MKLQTDLFVDPPLGDFTGGRVPEDWEIQRFREYIYVYYGQNGRSFPWRDTADPYEILVSEIMLQQTQTGRVLPKYLAFLSRWPDFSSLSTSSLAEVISAWSGLGYNRRAKALSEIAKIVDAAGRFPDTVEGLLKLPMVGRATAAAIMAFVYGKPVAYLETNIRRVYIHFFFEDRGGVHDRDIMPLAEAALDRGDPRQWHYALMDYGVHLRIALPNPNRRSAHYTRQSAFEGSDRQIRGAILRYFAGGKPASPKEAYSELPYDEERIARCLSALQSEGFLVLESGIYRIGD